MNKLDKDYQELLRDILENGVQKGDRTGTGTISVFGRQIRHKMSDGFPLLTTKKMAWNSMVAELIWFLRGDTNIKYLLQNNCHIWDGDAYKRYFKETEDIVDKNEIPFQELDMYGTVAGTISNGYARQYTREEFNEKIKSSEEFASKWGDLGPIYGKQWRSWTTKAFRSLNDGEFGYTYDDKPIDQIQYLINEIKSNPDSRRLMVNAWNVEEIDNMVLPPCHYGFQVYTRELSIDERLKIHCEQVGIDRNPGFELGRSVDYYHTFCGNYNVPKRAISLLWNQRSVDTFLGLPFNIASYGLLLEIIAKIVNMVPDELIGNLGDTHLYSNHVEQAREQISRESYELPSLEFSDNFLKNIDRYTGKFKILDSVDFGYYNQFDNFVHTFQREDFIVKNYQSQSTIKAPLSN